MAKKKGSAMAAVGLTVAIFALAGVAAVVVVGIPGEQAAAVGREQAAVRVAVKDQYWAAQVDFVKWWAPVRSGGKSTVRVRYTVSRDGASAPLDEIWSYDYRTGRAAYLWQTPSNNADSGPVVDMIEDIANGKFTK